MIRERLSLPVVDISSLESRETLLNAARDHGMFYLTGHGVDLALIKGVLEECRIFFESDETAKMAINSRFSPHFRGYTLLKNHRDWREQIHLGSEIVAGAEEYWQLAGPNLWPEKAEFRARLESYMKAIEDLSRLVLEAIASAMGRSPEFFTGRMKDRPYQLVKCMCYHPQDGCGEHIGVTSHYDWCWLTFLIQDDIGGLEALSRSGVWTPVVPLDDAIIVNTGELIEIETGGRIPASAHRVLSRERRRNRYSVAVFVNPALDERIFPERRTGGPGAISPEQAGEHVHRVIGNMLDEKPFLFGEAEWQRKGEGKWCARGSCLQAPVAVG
ncbi:MAG: isopenicillin N synthase family dioxygenase [Candidatus Obscuribacterales bacterium]